MKLTIAIPTYNRNKILGANLAVLLPQLQEFAAVCRVHIFDNCSPTPVADTLGPLLEAFPEIKCTLTRNRVNVGGNANIMHCFEACETEWIWVMGDDDTVTAGAVAAVLRSLQRYPEALFFSYSTAAYPIAATTSCRGLAGFVGGIGSFSNTLFLSTSIYRIGALVPTLRVGYQWAYSGAPHLAMLLSCLGERSQTCFCEEEIVIQNDADDPLERWSLIAYAVAAGTLLDLPLPQPVREMLAAKMLVTFPTTEQIVMQLVLQAVKDKNSHPALFYYQQILDGLYRFDTSPVRRLKRRFYRVLLRFPRLGHAFVALAYRATRKRAIDPSLLHDRFARM